MQNLKDQVQELHRDLTKHHSLIKAEIMGDILHKALQVDAQIASEYASVEGLRAVFQEVAPPKAPLCPAAPPVSKPYGNLHTPLSCFSVGNPLPQLSSTLWMRFLLSLLPDSPPPLGHFFSSSGDPFPALLGGIHSSQSPTSPNLYSYAFFVVNHRVATREESRVLCFPSRRGLTPRVSL